MARQNFSGTFRDHFKRLNGRRNIGSVPGVQIDDRNQSERLAGAIMFCENCKFCHTNPQYFDVDHLVPDAQIQGTGQSSNITESDQMQT